MKKENICSDLSYCDSQDELTSCKSIRLDLPSCSQEVVIQFRRSLTAEKEDQPIHFQSVANEDVKPKKLSLVEFCSGIGGNRLAFQDYFKVIASAEILPDSIKTYEDNFGNDDILLGDLTLLKPQDVPKADGYLISSPCQSFSFAGNKKGLKDDRGQVLLSFFELVKANKPKFFFIENVMGMKTVNRGRDFRTILKTIKDLGYSCHYEVIASSDFGVPQMRKRLYIVAFIENIEFEFPKAWACEPKSKDVLLERVHESYFLTQEQIDSKVSNRDRQAKKGNAFGYRTLNLNGSARTLLKSHSSKDKNIVLLPFKKNQSASRGVFHDKKSNEKYFMRFLTPREYARIQGFPDSFKLTSSEAKTYEQLGNSVSVPVLREIAKEIFLAFSVNRPKSNVRRIRTTDPVPSERKSSALKNSRKIKSVA